MPICPKCGDKNPQLGVLCPRDGAYYIYESALKQAETDPRIGTLAAGKYVIVGRISKGGMGAVYRALQLPVEREIALKVLRTELETSDQGRDRFLLEARAVGKLSHPNVIMLIEYGIEEDTGHPFMAMEYAPGRSLTDWIYDENPGLEEILAVTEQILSALTEAHNQGIIHRDLKPDNMILTESGGNKNFVKLLDFGIARMINERATRGITREGEVFGTPDYMSPEQAQGLKDIGPQVDVYAMGIMMWEMLCKRVPFEAEKPLAILMKHISHPLPALVPSPGLIVPGDLERIIQKAAAKNPKDRFKDAGELLQAISALRKGDTETVASFTGEFAAASASRGVGASRSMEVQATIPDMGAVTDRPPPSWELLEEEVTGTRKSVIIAGVSMLAIILAVGSFIAFKSMQDDKDTSADAPGEHNTSAAGADKANSPTTDTTQNKAPATTLSDAKETETTGEAVPTNIADPTIAKVDGSATEKVDPNAAGQNGAPKAKDDPKPNTATGTDGKEEKDSPKTRRRRRSKPKEDDKPKETTKPKEDDKPKDEKTKDDKKPKPVRFDSLPRKW